MVSGFSTYLVSLPGAVGCIFGFRYHDGLACYSKYQAWDEDSPIVLEDEDEDFQSYKDEDEDEDRVL